MTIGKSSPARRPPGVDVRGRSRRSHQTDQPAADRLVSAGWLVGTAAALVVLWIVTAAYDGLRGMMPRPEGSGAVYGAMGSSEIALTPAGRRERAPLPSLSAIDWRYLPSLPDQDPGLTPLLDTDRLVRNGASGP